MIFLFFVYVALIRILYLHLSLATRNLKWRRELRTNIAPKLFFAATPPRKTPASPLGLTLPGAVSFSPLVRGAAPAPNSTLLAPLSLPTPTLRRSAARAFIAALIGRLNRVTGWGNPRRRTALGLIMGPIRRRLMVLKRERRRRFLEDREAYDRSLRMFRNAPPQEVYQVKVPADSRWNYRTLEVLTREKPRGVKVEFVPDTPKAAPPRAGAQTARTTPPRAPKPEPKPEPKPAPTPPPTPPRGAAPDSPGPEGKKLSPRKQRRREYYHNVILGKNPAAHKPKAKPLVEKLPIIFKKFKKLKKKMKRLRRLTKTRRVWKAQQRRNAPMRALFSTARAHAGVRSLLKRAPIDDFFNPYYLIYKSFIMYNRKIRHSVKHRAASAPSFFPNNFDFMFSLFKTIRRRRAVLKKMRDRRKYWRYFYLKKRFIRRHRFRVKPAHYLRRYQNFKPPAFLARLTGPLLRFGIRPRPRPYNQLLKLSTKYPVLRRALLRRRYYLIIRRKRSNLYYTIIDHLGGVVYSISVGRFVSKQLQRRNRKLRRGYSDHHLIIKLICRTLRRKKIYRLHAIFKPVFMRTYVLKKVVNNFRASGIRIMKISYTPRLAHGRVPKRKKARRL